MSGLGVLIEREAGVIYPTFTGWLRRNFDCGYSLRISSPIQLHPALRSSVSSLPVLWPLRPIPAMPDGSRLPGGFFPVVVSAPMLQRLNCSRSQHPARALGDSGGRVLPIAPRILLGSTCDKQPFSVNQCSLASIEEQPAFKPFSRSARHWLLALMQFSNRVCARAES